MRGQSNNDITMKGRWSNGPTGHYTGVLFFVVTNRPI